MLKSVLIYGLSVLAMSSGAAVAQESCDTYSVIPGDTLRLIAERYYGSRDQSPIIYNANIDVIGANPNEIEIGMELAIPCRENMRHPEPTAFLALVEPQHPPQDASHQVFLAKAGTSPFIDADNSGLFPDIIAAALRAGGDEAIMEIERPASISDVLQISVDPNKLLSFPWPMPDCAHPEALSPQSEYICSTYEFSDPIFEITLGLFTLANSPLAAADTAADFKAVTICVPQFHSSDLLETNGIEGTGATIVISKDLQSCMSGMAAGEYDALVADYQSISFFAPESNDLQDIPAFAHQTTLHAIAYKQNPVALEVLGELNIGLKNIMSSGEWFGIVSEHIAKLSN